MTTTDTDLSAQLPSILGIAAHCGVAARLKKDEVAQVVRLFDRLRADVQRQEGVIADIVANGVDDVAGAALDERDEEIDRLRAEVEGLAKALTVAQDAATDALLKQTDEQVIAQTVADYGSAEAAVKAVHETQLRVHRTLIDHLKARATAAEAERDAALAQARAMREALEPFAAVAEHDIGGNEADADLYRPMSSRNACAPLLTVGDLRRASAALSTPAPAAVTPAGAADAIPGDLDLDRIGRAAQEWISDPSTGRRIEAALERNRKHGQIGHVWPVGAQPDVAQEVVENPCIRKLQPGEPFFVLIGRDAQAADAVRYWAYRREVERGPGDKVAAARHVADQMDAYRGTKARASGLLTEGGAE